CRMPDALLVRYIVVSLRLSFCANHETGCTHRALLAKRTCPPEPPTVMLSAAHATCRARKGDMLTWVLCMLYWYYRCCMYITNAVWVLPMLYVGITYAVWYYQCCRVRPVDAHPACWQSIISTGKRGYPRRPKGEDGRTCATHKSWSMS